MICKEFLESQWTFEKSPNEAKNAMKRVLDENHHALMKQVGLNQRAIKINDECFLLVSL
jgi:hypothetical protein